MNNVPPSVRAALKRRGQDAILQQEGDYQTFKPQIDAILHSDENVKMSDDVMIEDYEADLSPEEQKATDRIEELGDKYGDTINLDNKKIDITEELNKMTEKVPLKPDDDFDDFEGRVWSEISNSYRNTLSPEAMEEIAYKRAKELWDSKHNPTINGAEVIGGDDDIENILKDDTPLTEAQSKALGKYKSEDEYEGSPMKEFSGPEGSDLSYAQLEASKKDDDWKSYFSGDVIEDYGNRAIVQLNSGEYVLWSKTNNRPISSLDKNNELIPMKYGSLDELKKDEKLKSFLPENSPMKDLFDEEDIDGTEDTDFTDEEIEMLNSEEGRKLESQGLTDGEIIEKLKEGPKKYDWKPYNGSDNLDKGGFLRDNEDSNLSTKYADYGPKYKGGYWGRNGYQSYGYDMNQWQGTYHDNIGTSSKSPWFKTKEEAQKWAEERYEKGITEITPERIEELAAKYGQEDIHTENNGYGDVETGRTIHTGLTGKEDLEVLNSTLGQLSDGIWENSRAAERFWKNLDVYRNDDGEIVIDTKTRDYNSPFRGKTPQDVMKYLAKKAKQVVRTEIDDGANAQWDRNSDYQLDYMGDSKTPIKISDVYRTYDRLLGRKQKEAKPAETKAPVKNDIQSQYNEFNKSWGDFINSQGSDQDHDKFFKEMVKTFGSPEEAFKKLAERFRGQFK